MWESKEHSLKDHPVIPDLMVAATPVGDLITQTRVLAHEIVAAKATVRNDPLIGIDVDRQRG